MEIGSIDHTLMEPVVGKLDIVLINKGKKSKKIRVGRVEKVSKQYKERLKDGKHHDICTEPIYSWLYPKIIQNEETFQLKPNEVQVCSRHFRIGDMVKLEDRLGYVLNIFQKPTVKLMGHDFIIHKVDPNQLVDPWMSFVIPKRPILYKGWIGKIGPTIERRLFFIVDCVHRFSCTWDHFSLFCLQEGLITKSSCTFEVNGFSFYPGRKFFVKKENLVKRMFDGIFICMDTFPDVDKFYGVVPIEIIRTELSPFPVLWLCNTSGRDLSIQPPGILFAEDLTNITWICPFDFLNLGDVRMFNLDSNTPTNVYHIQQWKDYLMNRYCSEDRARCNKSLQTMKYTKDHVMKMLNYNCQNLPVEVIYLTTEVEIGWIDGKQEVLDSRHVFPVRPNTLPIGSFVQNIEEEDRDWKTVYGVVQLLTLNVHQRDMAVVKWIRKERKGSFEDNRASTSQVPLNILRKHSYYDFTSETKQNVVVTNLTNKNCSTPLVGFIINNFPNGRLRIRTTNGKLYSAWPDEVVRVTPKI